MKQWGSLVDHWSPPQPRHSARQPLLACIIVWRSTQKGGWTLGPSSTNMGDEVRKVRMESYNRWSYPVA